MLYDPERKWAPRGICRWEERDLFFAPHGQPDRAPSAQTKAKWGRAKEICAMCPALAECQRDTLGEPYGVFGGYDEHQRHLIRRKLPRAVKTWPRERQLAWGKELHALREADLTWKVIQVRCGIGEAAGAWLVAFWLANKPEEVQQPAPKVVDLQLPERREFPDKPGRRHAWVRHNGVISDAWYLAQTPEGDQVKVMTVAGRGNSIKWVPVGDVKLYRPQPVVIARFAGRYPRRGAA